MTHVFFLLIIYQLKHFLADFPLQGKYMLGKFKTFPDYILPLTAHGLVHGFMTLLIALPTKPNLAIQLAITDFIIHFIMDRVKASPNLLGRFKPLTKETYPMADKMALRGNTLFWWSLGLDQMVHHLTHYYIIWRLVT